MIHTHVAVDKHDTKKVVAGRRADDTLVIEIEGLGFSITVDFDAEGEKRLEKALAEVGIVPRQRVPHA